MTNAAEYRFQCGDIVRHKPSGEKWVVAAADHDADDLMPCGWPETMARASDCELLMKIHPEEGRKLHRLLDGARRSMADRVYGALPPLEGSEETQ